MSLTGAQHQHGLIYDFLIPYCREKKKKQLRAAAVVVEEQEEPP